MNHIDDVDLARMFWLNRGGPESEGPYPLKQLGDMFRAGQVYPTANVCEEGSGEWMSVANLRRDFPSAFGAAPATAASSRATATPAPEVHPGIYRVLAFFFGYFGVHNFYGGAVRDGVAKLAMLGFAVLLSNFGYLAGLVAVALFVGVVGWTFVEMIVGPRRANW